MPPHRVGNVTDPGHVSVELRHRAVLLDLLGEDPLRAEGLVRRHRSKGHTKPPNLPQSLNVFFTM